MTFYFSLYVVGQSAKSVAAISNPQKICTEHLDSRYRIEVEELAIHPALSAAHQIVAIHTLIRMLPLPVLRILGDLSNTERVLVSLDNQTAEQD